MRPLLLLITIVIAGSLTLAQEQHAVSSVQLIPQPRQIAVKKDVFRLGNNTRIAFADTRSEDDRFAAEDFLSDLNAKLAIKKASWQDKPADRNSFDEDSDWAFSRNEGDEFTKALRNRQVHSRFWLEGSDTTSINFYPLKHR